MGIGTGAAATAALCTATAGNVGLEPTDVMAHLQSQTKNGQSAIFEVSAESSRDCFVERFGIEKSEYELDILQGNRSADGRPMVKVSGYGKYTAADAVDFAAGRPYVRRPAIEHTVRSLVGPDVELPDFLAGASLRQPGHLDVLRERSPQLSAINSGGWEKVTLIVDSGASDTVIPPKVCRAAEIRSSSKVGTEYEVADGGVAKNLGEKLCEMKVNESDDIGLEIAFQVVDKVNKALLSVHRVCMQGHDVVFSETKGNFILLNGSTDNVIPLRTVGGTYEIDVWIRPGEGGGPSLGGAEAPFARPVNAR